MDRRFPSSVPFTRAEFRVPIFDPQPFEKRKQKASLRGVALEPQSSERVLFLFLFVYLFGFVLLASFVKPQSVNPVKTRQTGS